MLRYGMVRKSLPKTNETKVLVRSRRRCCICFGLNRDMALKAGQIAHLDQNNNNHSEENLAFLCFEHHDVYDSKSSQRKNFTLGEVKQFREELYSTISSALSQQVHFGDIKLPASDPYAGTYIRVGGRADSAEIKLIPLPDSYEGDPQYFASGFSMWGMNREYGPNLGMFQFIGLMSTMNELVYLRTRFADEVVSTKLYFHGDGAMTVTESNWVGEYGMNVTFEGVYERAS